jgi:hypothetical protein
MPAQSPTLDATVGGATSNSYLERAIAEQILSQYPQSTGIAAWFELTDDQKDQSLIAATLTLDGLSYSGGKCSCEQRLAWPRQISHCACTISSCASIPFDVQAAASLMAAQLGATGGGLFDVGSGGSASGGSSGLDQFEQVTLGPITVRMKQDATFNSNVNGDTREQIPTMVLSMLQPYMKGGDYGVYQGGNTRQSAGVLLQGRGRSAYSGTMRMSAGTVSVRPQFGPGWASWQQGTSHGGGGF